MKQNRENSEKENTFYSFVLFCCFLSPVKSFFFSLKAFLPNIFMHILFTFSCLRLRLSLLCHRTFHFDVNNQHCAYQQKHKGVWVEERCVYR